MHGKVLSPANSRRPAAPGPYRKRASDPQSGAEARCVLK